MSKPLGGRNQGTHNKEATMKNYYRVMLGRKSTFAKECIEGGFIGTDYNIHQDLTNKLPDEWRVFNKEFIPVYLENNLGKSRVAAGLACGMTWTVTRGLNKGDIILSPDGVGHYHIGEISGDYYYQENGILPQRRPVHWFEKTIKRADMSDDLRHAAGAIGTIANLNVHAEEIERLISGVIVFPQPLPPAAPEEKTSAFPLEEHLEEFLVKNWKHTDLGKNYDIYDLDGEIVGQQYQVDTGKIDILAISKDKKTLLVLELKRGRASDTVVGQTLRYMGYVKEELAEEGQDVKGVIIGLEDDQRIKRALSVSPNIEFYRYQVSFKLVKG
jgi:restriction system protein